MKRFDPMTATPDAICAKLQEAIREGYGDKVENASYVYGKAGYYFVVLPRNVGWWTLRRKQVAQAIKNLRKGKAAK